MLKVIREFLEALYDYEGDLVDTARQNGYKFIRLTTVLFILIALLYLLSPYDIISEAFVKPRAIGYIDDLIVIIIVAGYSYGDIKEVLKNGEVKVQSEDDDDTEESNRKDKVPSPDEFDTEYTNNNSASSSNEFSYREEPGEDFSRDTHDFDDYLDSDNDDIEDSGESSRGSDMEQRGW